MPEKPIAAARSGLAISPHDRRHLLEFVDKIVPPGTLSVWLTGSRATQTHRPDSDWDVLVVHPDAPDREDQIFDRGTQKGIALDGNEIELVVVRQHWLDASPNLYFVGCRQNGIRLR